MGRSGVGHRARFAEEARVPRPDLALLCLLVAAETDPALDEGGIDDVQIELDELAGQLPYAPGGPRAWARAAAELLGERYGFRGTPGDYSRLESSQLHEVLRRRRGLPIMLSVIWMEVARRAGAPVYGVALPGHFVVGFGPPPVGPVSTRPTGPDNLTAPRDPAAPAAGDSVLADPFDGGRLLSPADAELLVAEATGGEPLSAAMLVPADPLDIVRRILNNIRAWAAPRPEQSDVQLAAVELALLLPSHPARLRHERAQLLIARGDFVTGAAELEEYASVIAAMEPQAADTLRRQARAARARLN
ncbi:transglutaminase-like domain-containing protein [Streptomyces sp. WMMC500]|uniref:transglutaminase-like domain-containing protein n=1 Tax=Streptomyces sp. WMMC500 TaxID=3015154 RepID=UPI00248CE9E6|nr:transglutaminase-like domain-containing protein [Streptomyces sp. WMMC500]WBB63298.1 transglutaminase-like domain-containing protein [Streptomyces sp. WMMC500]